MHALVVIFALFVPLALSIRTESEFFGNMSAKVETDLAVFMRSFHKVKGSHQTAKMQAKGDKFQHAGWILTTTRVNPLGDGEGCKNGFVDQVIGYPLGQCIGNVYSLSAKVDGENVLVNMNEYESETGCKGEIVATSLYQELAVCKHVIGVGSGKFNGEHTSSTRVVDSGDVYKQIYGYGIEVFHTQGDCKRGSHPWRFTVYYPNDSCRYYDGKNLYEKTYCTAKGIFHTDIYKDKFCHENLLEDESNNFTPNEECRRGTNSQGEYYYRYVCSHNDNLVRKNVEKYFIGVMEAKICYTKVFSVWDVNNDLSISHRDYRDFEILASDSFRSNRTSIYSNLNRFGCCILCGFMNGEKLKVARRFIKQIADKLIERYDEAQDEFDDVDQDEFSIVRMPRIGKGKHNIHFDPETSHQHMKLLEMVLESRVCEYLSYYMSKTCVLRETGISLTRPIVKVNTLDDSIENISGEGMEWHSDGPRGEATMLMSIDDIDESMGSLRVVPRSHKRYIDGIGHDEDVIKGKLSQLSSEKVCYEYNQGNPMLIDARTLHSVSRNVSNKWRIVVWFIFDSF